MSLIQPLESQHQHPLAQLPPLHHRKNTKSPRRIKLACRGGLLNQQQTGPTLPRTLRSVLKKGSALLFQISLGINFLFKGCDGDALPHTHHEILLVCNIFCNIVSHLCVGVLSRWAVSFLSSPNVWVLFSPSSSPTDSSECLIMSSLWTVDESSAVLFSLSLHTDIPFTTSHKLAISAPSSMCVADVSPVSCTSAPALDRVSASALKLFIIVPQGISLTLQLPAWWRTACSSLSSRPKSSRFDSRYGFKTLFYSDSTSLLQVIHSVHLAPKCTSGHIFPYLSFVSLFQESRKRVKHEKKEPLVESQLFIMELARELNKICQVSSPPPILSYSHRQTWIYSTYLINTILYIYTRGQAFLAISGPVRTSGQPVCVGILLWNGLLCWRRECR